MRQVECSDINVKWIVQSDIVAMMLWMERDQIIIRDWCDWEFVKVVDTL